MKLGDRVVLKGGPVNDYSTGTVVALDPGAEFPCHVQWDAPEGMTTWVWADALEVLTRWAT